MKKLSTSLCLLMLCSPVWANSGAALTNSEISQVLTHIDRPKADLARDAARHPDKILAFSGVAKGDTVLDLFAGGGWYSELFAHAVGAKGKVYLQNDEVIWRFAEQDAIARTANNRLPNVIRLDKIAIADIDVPAGSVDIAFMALNYHDLFFTQMIRDGKTVVLREQVVDYRAALATIKSALNDDGVLIIIDHFGAPGSGYEAPNSVHRIDPAIVKYQLEQAGFSLAEEAMYLRNAQDDYSKSVFDPSVRGNTDRFVYKFVKK
ncbi:MAG: class I SAM-dependent methyltransferase [Paraglaciecola sp.]|nr:class I SAM-dependent methyltransferase [Paraglaciecola sp.]NCT48581.1 class I SAM-dependent methyltransferase [Paraglaciecola sp.]